MTPPLSIIVPPSTSFLSPIRGMVTSWLGLNQLRADRWCLVVTELVTNAMTVTGADQVVTVDLAITGTEVELSVGDGGPGVELQPIAQPDPTAPRGRGLLIVDALTSALRSERRDGTTVISCRRSVADDRTGSGSAQIGPELFQGAPQQA